MVIRVPFRVPTDLSNIVQLKDDMGDEKKETYEEKR